MDKRSGPDNGGNSESPVNLASSVNDSAADVNAKTDGRHSSGAGELPKVFTTEKIPVSESSIPRQEDVDRWPHLKNVQLRKINSSTVSLLIGNDVPGALESKEVIECSGKGPYAIRTVLGWTINGPKEKREFHPI